MYPSFYLLSKLSSVLKHVKAQSINILSNYKKFDEQNTLSILQYTVEYTCRKSGGLIPYAEKVDKSHIAKQSQRTFSQFYAEHKPSFRTPKLKLEEWRGTNFYVRNLAAPRPPRRPSPGKLEASRAFQVCHLSIHFTRKMPKLFYLGRKWNLRAQAHFLDRQASQ